MDDLALRSCECLPGPHLVALPASFKQKRSAISARERHTLESVMSKILPVIMCGGSGPRVWPEFPARACQSRFIPLIGDRSTFQSIIALLDR